MPNASSERSKKRAECGSLFVPLWLIRYAQLLLSLGSEAAQLLVIGLVLVHPLDGPLVQTFMSCVSYLFVALS
jgi:hypothetical protein